MTSLSWLELVRRARRSWRWGLVVLVSTAAIGAASVMRQASRALRDAAARVESQSELPFTVTQLDTKVLATATGLAAPAEPPAAPASALDFEPISSPAVFNDVAPFQRELFVSGPSGLFVYERDGHVTAQYRVGLDLPAAPLVSMATGVESDGSEPELLIATAGEGLLVFNGRSFRQVRAAEAPYRALTAVLPLETGRVLLGTEKKGVLVYDGKRLGPFLPMLADVHVTALQGSEASLWIGTLDRGVWHWHAGQLDRFSEPEQMPDPQVLSIAVGGDAAYAGTPLGVAEFRDGRFTRVLASGYVARSLLIRREAGGETLMVGTVDEGTIRVPLAAHAPSPLASEGEPVADDLAGAPRARTVERLLEVGGKVYALADNGLYSLGERDGAWQPVVERQAALLTDRNVSALAVDRAGKLWVGYFDRGLDIVDGISGPGEPRATHVENDHVFCVNRIVPDPDRGATAVATANGLVMFDVAGRVRQVMGRAEGLIADQITDVLVRPEGIIAATPAGITLIDSSGTRSLYAFQGLVNNHVYALASSGGRLLAGTLGGLTVLDRQPEPDQGGPARVSRLGDAVVRANYTTANSRLQHNWITAIVPVGEEWFVGTYGAGILRFDGSEQWDTLTGVSGPFVVNPNAMLVTPAKVYACTLDRGLYVYDRASGRGATLTKGLPSANVQALAASGGYLYVGTDNGLVRMADGGESALRY
ncbi:MAG TPA: hypothetical protein VKU44_00300 [Terriglobia bacterium]|nr:hypothetical protein [Terriglobia bacterium]